MSLYEHYNATTTDNTIDAFFAYYLFGYDPEKIQNATYVQFLKAQGRRSTALALEWSKDIASAYIEAIGVADTDINGKYTREQLAAAWGPWNVVKKLKAIKPRVKKVKQEK